MGLAASQARLLSLTNRQHSVESEAQRLENFKLQLAKNSDSVYQTYLNALDATTLKTKQTDAYGDTNWISGNINNLMRYGADEDTSGYVFYLQDVATGKLYVPEQVGEYYDLVTPSGDSEADARSFAELFGVTYTECDYNEYILTNYQEALDNGWDTLMTSSQLEDYYTALSNDVNITNKAAVALSYIPEADSDGLYLLEDEDYSYGSMLSAALQNVAASWSLDPNDGTDDARYSETDKAVINSAINLLSMLELLAEQQYEALNVEQYEDYDFSEGAKLSSSNVSGLTSSLKNYTIYGTVLQSFLTTYHYGEDKYTQDDDGDYIVSSYTNENNEVVKTAYYTINSESTGIYACEDDNDDVVWYNGYTSNIGDNNWLYLSFSTSTSASTSDGTTYLSADDSSTYSNNDLYLMLLNGGTASMSIVQNEYVYNTENCEVVSDTDYTIVTYSTSIYDYYTYNGESITDLLDKAGYSSYGEALTAILTKVVENTFVSEFYGDTLTYEDVTNYKKYLSYLAEYEDHCDSDGNYVPDTYYVPDDSTLAAWAEEVYAAITAAGGYITVSDTQAKNASWVTNMIKNAQAVLATYDSDDDSLSKTSASLNTALQEVTDDTAIDEADAEYEYQMAIINNKDSQYDTKLEMLETERSAISTEIDSLKTVAEENVESTFSLFS